MKSMALRAHGKGLELLCEIRPQVPAWLVGDPGRLRQIVVNLVGNAIKFTESGEVALSVACESPVGEVARLHCRISDTGIGIDPAKMSHIFHPFEQADNSTTRRFGGTGIGLTLVKKIVENHQGTVSVSSRPGEGSVFTIRLPRERRRDSADSPPPPPEDRETDNGGAD